MQTVIRWFGFIGVKPASLERAASHLADVFNPRSNSIGFLRFAFAATVLLNHSAVLGGLAADDPLMYWSHGQISFASMAVDGFFVLSGYLITRSFFSSPSPARYLWRRFLRIFPAFWVCLAVTAFICAPIVLLHERGTLAGASWFNADDSPVSYVLHNWSLGISQWNIWHLLSSVPQTRMEANFGVPSGAIAFDRSLWTLRYEFECYLLVAVCGALGVLSGRKGPVLVAAWTAFLGASLFASVIAPDWLTHLPTQRLTNELFTNPDRLRLWFLFGLGASMYVYARRIPMRPAYGLLAAAMLIGSLGFGGYAVVGRIAFAYVCMGLAIYLPVRHFDRRGDFSYGVYIYGWLIAQMLAVFEVYRLGYIPYMAFTAVMTLALAVLSWHLVEAPALRLKSINPPNLRLELLGASVAATIRRGVALIGTLIG